MLFSFKLNVCTLKSAIDVFTSIFQTEITVAEMHLHFWPMMCISDLSLEKHPFTPNRFDLKCIRFYARKCYVMFISVHLKT